MLSQKHISRAIDAAEKLRVRSALNPVLWLCGIVSIPALAIIPFVGEPPLWLVLLICAPVVTAILGFIFLLFFDRDKLQSEDYQIRKRSLDIIEQKGDLAPIVIDSTTLALIPKPKPSSPELTEGKIE